MTPTQATRLTAASPSEAARPAAQQGQNVGDRTRPAAFELIELKRRTQTTIVFVTHSVAESVYLSTRVVVLSAGGGRVIDEITIEPQAPRDAEYRLGPEFSAYVRRASAALRRAMSVSAP